MQEAVCSFPLVSSRHRAEVPVRRSVAARGRERHSEAVLNGSVQRAACMTASHLCNASKRRREAFSRRAAAHRFRETRPSWRPLAHGRNAVVLSADGGGPWWQVRLDQTIKICERSTT